MMLLTTAYLLEKYGVRLTMEELAAELDLSKQTIANRISRGVFECRTYVDGGKRFADVRDVAEYLDRARSGAQGATAYTA